jgi:hypothetical protein
MFHNCYHFLFKQPADKNSELYKTILSKDSLHFNVGFNRCDKQFEILLSGQPKILSRQRRNFR